MGCQPAWEAPGKEEARGEAGTEISAWGKGKQPGEEQDKGWQEGWGCYEVGHGWILGCLRERFWKLTCCWSHPVPQNCHPSMFTCRLGTEYYSCSEGPLGQVGAGWVLLWATTFCLLHLC